MFGRCGDLHDQSGQFRAAQALASNPDDGGFTATSNCHERKEIGIQRNNNPPVRHGRFENPSIAGCTHTDFADMQRIPTIRPENFRSLARQALVQQKPRQAASRRTTSSSI